MDDVLTDRTPNTGHDGTVAAALLTAQDAAAVLGVNERTIRRAIASGALPARKHHGVFRIAATALQAWSDARRAAVAGGPAVPGQRPRSTPELPRPLTPLFGREQAVQAVCALLGRPGIRLVTLTGPGGVGKTRLALEVAASLVRRFPAGVWFVPLAGVAEADRVIDAINYGLGIAEPGRGSRREALVAALRDEEAILVLDNFEQVLAAAGDVAALLAACPALKVLVTSRTLLRISGEHAVPVPALPIPAAADAGALAAATGTPAVQLFAERAQSVMPSFELTAATTPVVVEICRLLDGVPLAIELAAARVNALALPVLRDRLDQRLSLLTGGARDAPPRHRTMRDAVAWSYDLLSPEEQAVFRCLGAFAGGFTIEAAERVCIGVSSGPDAIVDLIVALVDSSLLRKDDLPDQDHRLGMLETIRAYAQERLEATGEAAAVRARHAAWCLDVIERVTRECTWEELWLLQPAEVEHDNVQAALAWLERSGQAAAMLRLAVANHPVWRTRGNYGEAITWLGRGLAVAGDAPPSLRLEAHTAIERLLVRRGLFAQAWEHGQAALALARELGDEPAAAQAVYALGGIATNQERYDHALPLLERALEQYLRLEDETGTCGAHYFLGIVRLGQDLYPEALSHLEDALAVKRTGHPDFNLSVLLNALGLVRCATGDVGGASRELAESRAVWEEGQGANQAILAEWLAAAASVALARHLHAQAARLLGAAEGLAEQLGVPLLVPPPRQHQRLVAMIRDRLGADRFAAERSAGRALPVAEVVAGALDEKGVGTSAGPPILSARELEVLRLVANGHRDREIANALFISVRTVEGHVAHLIAKLGVSSRPAAVRIAIAQGLLDPPPHAP